MTEEKLQQAKELEDKINHISEVIDFLKTLTTREQECILEEGGFLAHPQRIIARKLEVTALIQGLEEAKRELKFEFESL